MQTPRKDQSVRCFGCDETIWRRVRRTGVRAWCDRCAPLAADLLTIERTVRVLERFGVTEAIAPMHVALARIREQLHTGAGPARHIATEATRATNDPRKRAHERNRRSEIRVRLRGLIGGGGAESDWVESFALTVLHLEPDDWSDDDLLARYRSFAERDREHIRAGGCVCGHSRAHPEGVGCLARGCGCGSPARSLRAAAATARARQWNDDDLRSAWPRL
jgi:hypothetical protein